ncbi:hypothetical protein [Mesobacillus jeotgali]|uniref:hypothetical protein n=1 Tax=Mesobacillus jeotgali TaxID=129985 RepID=UPI0009A6270E|nr:hypothetical protein [Mesobacillus jeotgali]
MKKVICINNEGLELEFNKGEEYEVDKELETTYIITNRLGKKHTVFKTNFEPAENAEDKN